MRQPILTLAISLALLPAVDYFHAGGLPTPAPASMTSPVKEAEVPATTTLQVTSTPQPTATPISLGPEAQDFPSNYNPLTGQPVNDLEALDLPAMLISISNFPVDARPQAGLSFAPTFLSFDHRGATRFLSFYGDFPTPKTVHWRL
jgi:hypothetical protein